MHGQNATLRFCSLRWRHPFTFAEMTITAWRPPAMRLVMTWRGIKEGFRVLRKLNIPVEPAALKKFLWLPEPVMVAFLRKLLRNPRMEVAMVRHAEVIRDEIQQLNSEFLQLAEQSGYFHPGHPLPDFAIQPGSASFT